MATPTAELDLQTLCDMLGSVERKWFKIGIRLGIPRGKLLDFKKEDDPLSAVIDYWLRRNMPEEKSPISWEFIAKVLGSKYVGEPGLAEEIGKNFCQQESTCDADCAEGTSGTVLINPETITPETKETSQHDTGDSILAVSSPDASPSQKSKTPPKDSNSPLSMDPKVKEDLEFILQRNLKEIMIQYASYVDNLRVAIKDRGISADDLRSYLLSLPAITTQPLPSKLALLSDKYEKLQKCNTVTDIFNLLTRECASFLNYDIFRCILTHYKVSDNQEELQYPEQLRAYTEKHKISEFAKINPLLKSKSGCELIVKYDIETTCNLAKVIDLKYFIAEIMELNPSALEIVDIKDGCAIVTFLIPSQVAFAVKHNAYKYHQKFTDQKTKNSEAKLILWVKCNGRLITARSVTPSWDAEVKKPRGIAVNQRGEVIVSECVGHCVTIFSPSGMRLRSFGTHGSDEGQFEYPYGVAVDSDDNILVADCGNHRIQKFTMEGTWLAVGTQGSEPLQFDLPRAITVSASNGRVYVTSGNNSINILNSDLSYFGTFGHLEKVNQLACDSEGNVYAADSTGVINVFTAEGKHLRNFETKGDYMADYTTIAITDNDKVVVAHDNVIDHNAAIDADIAYDYDAGYDDADYVAVCDAGLSTSGVAAVPGSAVALDYNYKYRRFIYGRTTPKVRKNILSIFSSNGRLLESITSHQLLEAITTSQPKKFPGYRNSHPKVIQTEFCGLAVNSKDNIYVCDYLNNQIICYSLK